MEKSKLCENKQVCFEGLSQIGYDRANTHVRQKSWPVAINSAALLPTTKHQQTN